MAISHGRRRDVWGLIYDVPARGPAADRPAERDRRTELGGDPVAWLQQTTLHLNSLLLMMMLLWAQVGFAMVLLSAAIKGVPVDTLEAARIDGAERAADLLPRGGAADQGHDHHGLRHRR